MPQVLTQIKLKEMDKTGSSWGKTRYATATAVGEVAGRTYVAVGRSAGDNSRFKIFPFDGESLGKTIDGGDDWGKTRGATALAFGNVGGNSFVAVGRSKGDNSRFKLYPFDGRRLGGPIDGGKDWGKGRETTATAFGEVGGQTFVGVGRSAGDNSRFKVYPFDGRSLGDPISEGDDWGKDRYATALAIGEVGGRTFVAVGRSIGNNSRFKLYPFDGRRLGDPIDGGDDWGRHRGATAIAFTEVSGQTYVAVGRSAGNNSRFKLYPFDGRRLGKPIDGGENWGKDRGATALTVGEIGGETFVAVGRNAGDNSRYKVYPFDGRSLGDPANGGEGWGHRNFTTGLAFATLGGQLYLAISRKTDDNSRFYVDKVEV